jgi:hypothetical protein
MTTVKQMYQRAIDSHVAALEAKIKAFEQGYSTSAGGEIEYAARKEEVRAYRQLQQGATLRARQHMAEAEKLRSHAVKAAGK